MILPATDAIEILVRKRQEISGMIAGIDMAIKILLEQEPLERPAPVSPAYETAEDMIDQIVASQQKPDEEEEDEPAPQPRNDPPKIQPVRAAPARPRVVVNIGKPYRPTPRQLDCLNAVIRLNDKNLQATRVNICEEMNCTIGNISVFLQPLVDNGYILENKNDRWYYYKAVRRFDGELIKEETA